MIGRPPVVAIEGPCCAGKTTLTHGLVEIFAQLHVSCARDYSDHVGGGRFLPPPIPGTLLEEEQALGLFLAIEADRTAYVGRSTQIDLVIIDRSVHTLLAHCFAIGRLLREDYFGLAERVICKSSIPLWPHLVLYLDVPQPVIWARNNGKFALDSIFIDADFNIGVRSYFQQVARLPSPRVIWLDATVEAAMVQTRAAAQLRRWLEQAEGQSEGGA